MIQRNIPLNRARLAVGRPNVAARGDIIVNIHQPVFRVIAHIEGYLSGILVYCTIDRRITVSVVLEQQ